MGAWRISADTEAADSEAGALATAAAVARRSRSRVARRRSAASSARPCSLLLAPSSSASVSETARTYRPRRTSRTAAHSASSCRHASGRASAGSRRGPRPAHSYASRTPGATHAARTAPAPVRPEPLQIRQPVADRPERHQPARLIAEQHRTLLPEPGARLGQIPAQQLIQLVSIGTHRGRGPDPRAPFPSRTCSFPNGPRLKCMSRSSRAASSYARSRRDTASEPAQVTRRGRPLRAVSSRSRRSRRTRRLARPSVAAPAQVSPGTRRALLNRSSGSRSRQPNSASISTLRASRKAKNPRNAWTYPRRVVWSPRAPRARRSPGRHRAR